MYIYPIGQLHGVLVGVTDGVIITDLVAVGDNDIVGKLDGEEVGDVLLENDGSGVLETLLEVVIVLDGVAVLDAIQGTISKLEFSVNLQSAGL